MNRLSKVLLFAVLAIVLILFFTQTSFATSYTIDGDVMMDWGIDLTAATYGASDQGVYNSNMSFTHDGYLDTHTPTGENVDYITEDNADQYSVVNTYVEPGYTHTGNTYDAEAIYFDNDENYGYIAIITGVAPDETVYPAGDIAIDFGTDGGYGYEYGIDIDTGDLFKLPDWNETLYYSDANPWEINTGTDIGDATVFYTPYTASYDSDYNGHYVIEASFLLSDLGLESGDSFVIHWTMECGNDQLNLLADINHPVPEPATILLLGTGLIGIAGLGRKKFSKK